jgi:hypothetical protein
MKLVANKLDHIPRILIIFQVQQSKLADINLTCELTGHGLDEQDV